MDEIYLALSEIAMTKLPKSKARSVGVSNFTIEQLDAIIKVTGVVPSANQIERHPLLQSKELEAYCKEKGIHITAYSLYLIHWPVAFKSGANLFPLEEGKNLPDGDVAIDDNVSIVDTWKGAYLV